MSSSLVCMLEVINSIKGKHDGMGCITATKNDSMAGSNMVLQGINVFLSIRLVS